MQRHLIKIVAWVVGLVGVMDIISALYPPVFTRVEVLREFIPLPLTDLTRTLTLIIGIFILSLARGIAHRKYRAWKISVLLLTLSLAFHLFKGLDIEEFSATSVVLGVLVLTRSHFYVASDRPVLLIAFKNIFITFFLLFVYVVLGITMLQQNHPSFKSIARDYFYTTMGIGEEANIATTRWATWFEGSVTTVSLAAISLFVFTLFAPVFDHQKNSTTDKRTLDDLLQSGEHDEYAWFVTQPDKKIWFDDSGSHAIGYRCIGDYAVALPPLGPSDEGGTCWQFQQHLYQLGYKVLWYGMRDAALATKLGRVPCKIGETAIIDLDNFTLQGSKIADVRHAVTHLQREGVRYHWYNMRDLPSTTFEDIRSLYLQWHSAKKGPELTFSLGLFPLPAISDGHVLCVTNNSGKIWAVLSFYPYNHEHYTLDLMLHDSAAPNGVVEAAIAESATHFRTSQVRFLNLGVAPLADVTKSSHEDKLVRSVRSLLFKHFNQYYQYRSLYKFKNKFNPIWEPRYLFVPDLIGLPNHLGAVVRAHLKSSRKDTHA